MAEAGLWILAPQEYLRRSYFDSEATATTKYVKVFQEDKTQ
jgi:hypothetical protein